MESFSRGKSIEWADGLGEKFKILHHLSVSQLDEKQLE
jgi:hypothetical protein